jgi:hypothetical protein
MKAWHWTIWAIGWCTTLAMIVGIPFLKGGPDWYEPVFLVAAGYCIVARAAASYVRRGRRVPDGELWLRALATARIGFLVVIAVAVVMAGLVLIGLATK